MANSTYKATAITAVATILASLIAVGGPVIIRKLLPEPEAPPAYDLSTAPRAVESFRAACKARDLEGLETITSQRIQTKIHTEGKTINDYLPQWIDNVQSIVSVGGTEPLETTEDGESTTQVKVKYRKPDGELKDGEVSVRTEQGQWKFDDK
jgi:hypothetical protein